MAVPDSQPTSPQAGPEHPFDDLADFVAIPRLGGLALSPDGRRLITSVATLDPKGTVWRSALWTIDPTGHSAARRLTRGGSSESGPAFTPDGDLLFASARPDPDATDDSDPKVGLWVLPADGGEARLVLARPGGITAVAVARDEGSVTVVAPILPGAEDSAADKKLRSARKDAGVSAILHEDYPIRFWDHDLGPAWPHVLHLARLVPEPEPGTRRPAADNDRPDNDRPDNTAAAASGPAADGSAAAGSAATASDSAGSAEVEPTQPVRDLTPNAGLTSQGGDDLDLSPDGTTLVRTVEIAGARAGTRRLRLEVVDVASGSMTVLADEVGADFWAPSFAPDGRRVVCLRGTDSTFDEPPNQTIWLLDLPESASGDGPAGPVAGRDLAPDWDRWPQAPSWSADGTAILTTISEDGTGPIYRVPLDDAHSAPRVRLTASGTYTDLQVARDGSAVYALRAGYDSPPRPVRLDPAAPDQDPTELPAPGAIAHLPGTLHRIEATADDGVAVRSWLILPEGAGPDAPAPLLLWIHGGPLMSWNSWSWRWCPWLMVANGYAVLLPDPALSDGYGQDFVRRGWGQWGGRPYTDLMAAIDAALLRPDLDPERTAAMGGSFGGYMANWVATQTDRFDAIVTHASLWHLDGFSGATDAAYYWEKEFGDPLTQPERYEQNSPHRFADAIQTPMLVIHGDRDYRVPIGEGLRLWYDLQKRGVESKFLYFPDENHWVLTPGNAAVWYRTVLAFLGQHVLGRDWERPTLL